MLLEHGETLKERLEITERRKNRSIAKKKKVFKFGGGEKSLLIKEKCNFFFWRRDQTPCAKEDIRTSGDT